MADSAGTPRPHHQTKEKKSLGNDTKEGNQKKTLAGEAHPTMDSGGRITIGAYGERQGTGAGGEREQEG